MSRRAALVVLALAAVACGSAGSGSTECSSALDDSHWVADAVVDPLAPPTTFRLDLRVNRDSTGAWVVRADCLGTLVSSDGHHHPLEAGGGGPAQCPDDADVIEAEVPYFMMLGPPRTESLHARRVGDRLEGTITIEGLPTDFVAQRAP